MRICVIHGPNLDLLGQREPETYGTLTLTDINNRLATLADELGVELTAEQFASEGDIVRRIGTLPADGFAGLVINPAAYTHTSVAIRDAITGVGLPTVEVHLSNVHSREDFRHHSYTAPVCLGVVAGFGATSYLLALRGLVDRLTG